MKLKGRRIAVTGAFGSLGAAAVNAALREGARVIAIDRVDSSKAPVFEGEVKLLGNCDLSDAADAERTFAEAARAYDGLDGLLNIAGGFRWETLADGSIETWEAMFNINVRTAALSCKAALPYLAKQQDSAIVNIGANGAVKADAGMGAYAASKAGVARLTEALAEEMKSSGVRVNAVLPSIIDTPPNRADMPDADFSTWVRPAELASVLVFLLSGEASAVNAALLPVIGRV